LPTHAIKLISLVHALHVSTVNKKMGTLDEVTIASGILFSRLKMPEEN
jgi:hypothetical protein